MAGSPSHVTAYDRSGSTCQDTVNLDSKVTPTRPLHFYKQDSEQG